MKRCAIYARYSSDLQSPTSIDDQLQLCRAYAERHGWVVVATHRDAALSGFGVEQRPGYQQLVAAAGTTPPGFDTILVEDLSRLTRDTGELLRLYHRLRLKGIDIVGVSDGIASGQQGGKVHLTVKGLVNELYLDDLRDKTHRGLTGCATRGLSAGGRIFGYRTVPVEAAPRGTKHTAPARFEIHPEEAAVVQRIFRDYAAGQSMQAIAFALNRAGVHFPAQETERGPHRRGWAVSSVRVILRNEKYAGIWVWNKRRFIKDPDTGRRRALPRPAEDWIRHEHAALRVIDADLWQAVQQRLAFVEQTYGVGPGRPPRGAAHVAYSPYLLSGVLRCGCCGARMVAQTTTRKKGTDVYRYGVYRCGFAKTKGPAVCTHRAGYRQERLEGAVMAKFREAMTVPMIEALATMVNAQLKAVFQGHGPRTAELAREIERLEDQASHLVRFLATGGDSPAVRAELRVIETALAGLQAEWATIEKASTLQPPRVHPAWVMTKLERLDGLLRRDPQRAKVEILKHLDGDLVIVPRPSTTGERRAEISGRAKADSLLRDQEAVCLQVVAGLDLNQRPFATSS
jgi:DNA invertase Pin-like site-specific DNA recombinase